MKNSQNGGVTKILTAVTFLVMIIVNALANILPINGVNTGQIADSYKNLFAPAGLTFAIWGVIYFLLAGYVLYQFGFFQGKKSSMTLTKKVGLYFSVSSIANALWIFSWHYHRIAWSMVLMLIILICLIIITQTIHKEKLSKRDRLLIQMPFSVYYGWITVATIANATVFLVQLVWDGLGIPAATWTVGIIAVGLVIGVANLLKNKDIIYGLVIQWAYVGILIKHLSAQGFDGQYPGIIITTIVCIALLLVAQVFLIYSKKKRSRT